jgi:CheY-like chemotaxis protein
MYFCKVRKGVSLTEQAGASAPPGVRLRAIFAADCRRRIVGMRELCGHLDASAVSSLLDDAHAIRGGAAVVGLDRATETVDALEELLAGDNPEAAAVGRLLDELEASLPVAEAVPSLEDAGSADLVAATATLVHVDDDLTCRALIERLLELRPHVRLVAATAASEADLVVRDERPALVLLDLRLGGDSGWDVLHAIRADARTRDIPVVVLSADGDGDVDAATKSLVTARLQKPFSAEAFFALVDHFAPAA